jgi:hypothetical protein
MYFMAGRRARPGELGGEFKREGKGKQRRDGDRAEGETLPD